MFVKICGITREDDALLATALGADALGFNFAASSIRRVTLNAARDMLRNLPAEVMNVGIFRNELKEQVVETVHSLGLNAAQLHGNEGPEECRWIAERVPVTIKAFSAGSFNLDRFDEFGASILLLDSPTPGSGEVFDWSLAEGAPSGRRLLLAGGLDPDNVGVAIDRVRPWGVDVASGVEAEPGRKDPRKLKAFIDAARTAGEAIADERDGLPVNEDGSPYDWEADEWR